eukprot:COSAG02_NODE_5410_length_4351_cov_5.357479_5_plen_72_part_00
MRLIRRCCVVPRAQERIDVRAADPAAPTLLHGPWLQAGASSAGQQRFEFCMCNPPFFSSVSQHAVGTGSGP